ncbi:MAG TPA: hypothetical protein VM573_01445 [Actinomycetota bacterium]|nr:hypothetical protein [Actinomycetota bacterium]
MSLRLAIAAVAIVGAAAAAAGIGVRASYGAQVTGDEPHYLLTAISLAEDRSLNVSDEIRARRYLPFHEVPIDPQSRPLDERGTLVSPHDPLLPLLLAAPVAAGGWIAAKALLAALNGVLAGAVVWIAVRRFGAGVAPAALVAGVFAASAPFAVYGNQVYPELPAALAVTGATGALTGRFGRGGMTLLAASVIALPWLSVKYAPVAAALALLGLLRLRLAGRARAAAALAGGLGLAGAAFVVLHLAWYGGVTPYAAGDHFVGGELTVVGRPDFAGRSVRLVGLLIDREFGLAAWQPAWLLTLPAAGWLLRARPQGWPVLAAPFAAGWLTATFVALTMHGWWWPGRQVVVVLPAALIAVAAWTRSRRRLAAVVALGAAGIVTYAWFVVEGMARRTTWAVDFYEASVPIYRAWAQLLPAYREPGATTWTLHALWVVVAISLVVWGYRTASSSGR